MLESPIVKSIAEKAQKTPAQVHLGSPVLRCFFLVGKVGQHLHFPYSWSLFAGARVASRKNIGFLFEGSVNAHMHTMIFLVNIL